jgi:serine protease Do
VLAEHPSAAAVATMFETWTTGINTRDYGLSFSQYTGRLQQQVGFDAFASGNRSSQIVDFTVESVLGDSTLAVLATFTSRQDAQDGFDGQTCSVWRMEYEILSEADLLINRVRERTGGPDAC